MTVIIPKQAYLTIIAASVRFANQKIPKDKWIEANGIFIGKNQNDDVLISKAYPIMHEVYDPKAIVDKYVWSEEDYASTVIIEEEAFDKGDYVIGWWHSHPGFRVMLSGFGDRKTTVAYQSLNPLAISLVFNPERLVRQVEYPERKGDPVKQLKNDPGFKIFRLNDGNNERSNFHEIEYRLEGFESIEQLVIQAQKFVIDITNFFPSDNILETYDKFIKNQINQLNSLLLGTEEYLATLIRKGESHRIYEVLDNQTREIRKYVAETFIKIEKIKQFMEYLEFKERDIIIPKIEEVLAEWDECVSNLNEKLTLLSKKF